MRRVRSRRLRVSSEAILEEHRGLRDCMDEAARLAAGGARSWPQRLAPRLAVLAERLRAHFAAEEKAGLFEDIEEALPGAAAECERLRAEHRTLLERLEGLAARARARHSAEEAETFRADLRAVLGDAARHEETENDLLIRAVEGDEVGVAD
jgi:iron-sulfur cluster repair protein YtfE (RIC family)